MNVLLIDTSSNKEIIVGLRIGNKEYQSKQKVGFQKAQIVLPLIARLLKKHEISLSDIQSIQVSQGPGSFTGLRVGISVANALSFALKIPVNGKKAGEFVQVLYE